MPRRYLVRPETLDAHFDPLTLPVVRPFSSDDY
jgi:hypothetical protein